MKKVTSLEDYLNKLSILDQDKEYYYRGENRYFAKRSPSIYQAQDLLDRSALYYRRLLAEVPESRGQTPFDTLSKLQHYGAKTRLLDITSNPLIALLNKRMKMDMYLYTSKQKQNLIQAILQQ